MSQSTRPVLIVTPFFAPQSHAAVFRAYKLAKYLPQFGYQPHVLTVDVNYNYHEDPRLLSALPPEVTIHKARYIEPTRRGLRMGLGGRDETFLALKEAGALDGPGDGGGEGEAQRRAGLGLRTYRFLQKHVLNVPDAHWTWFAPAVQLGKRIIAEHGIDLLLSTAPPFTSHLVGGALAREGCRWICDLRDPEAFYYRTRSDDPVVYALQRKVETDAVRRADAVTLAAESIGMILTDAYGLRSDHPMHFIPTGLDDALVDRDARAPRSHPYLLFSGEYLQDYGDAFLRVFRDALEDPDVDGQTRFLICGYSDINRPRMAPFVARLGLQDRVEFVDHLPQEELYTLLRHSKAAVLQSTPRFRWWCLYAKLIDYIALQKPVVALIPDPSEARTHLQRTGLGVFLDGGHDQRVSVMKGFLSGRTPPIEPVPGECDRFLVQHQVSTFAALFDSVLNG